MTTETRRSTGERHPPPPPTDPGAGTGRADRAAARASAPPRAAPAADAGASPPGVLPAAGSATEVAAGLLAALEHAGAGVLLVGRDWSVLHRTAAAARLTGGPGPDGTLPTLWSSWPAAVGTRVERRLRRAMAERAPARFEHRDVTPADGDRWLEVVVAPTPDGLSVLLRDVTAQKRTEEALRRADERFDLVAEVVGAALYDWDLDVDVVSRSRGLGELLGYAPGEDSPAVDWWLDQVHPDDRERVRADLRAALAGGDAYRTECRARHKDGRYRRVVDRGRVVRDATGRAVRVVGATADVTAAQATEDELRRRADLLDQTEDAILAWDWPSGTITFWNRGAERLYGVPRAAALGRVSHELLRTRHPETTARFLRDLERDGAWSGELEHLRRDGGVVPVETRHTLVRAGDAPFVVEVNRDVSDRRALERLQEDFLAAASHDLRNPLGAVSGQAQLLRRRLQRGDPPDVDRLLAGLGTIDDTAAQMSALIDELGDVARLRAGQPLDLRREPVDLAALARRSADRYGRAGGGRVRVEVRAPVGVVGDERRLERVIANLLSNAVKYSPDGGEIVVRVARETDERGDRAVLSVADHGVGIPAADLPHVFDRFRRGANVGAIAGTGIGLNGARRIVEQHGGAIAVASDEGVGSTFTLRLPLAAAPA